MVKKNFIRKYWSIGLILLLLVAGFYVFGTLQSQRWVKNDYTTYRGSVGGDEINLKMEWHTNKFSRYWDNGDFNDSFSQSHDFKSSDGVFEYWRGIKVDENVVKAGENIGGWNDKPQWLVNLEGKRYPVQRINFDGFEMQQISGSCEVRSLQKKYTTGDYDYYHSEWYMFLTNCQMRGYIPLDSPVTFTSNGYVVVDIPKSGVECLDDSYCSGKSVCENNICVEEVEEQISPPEVNPPLFTNILLSIADWFDNVIASLTSFFTSQTIIGPQEAQPGTTQTYDISLSTTMPDTDFSDGTYQVQYGNWALINTNGDIIKQGTWEEIEGVYEKQVTITLPQSLEKFALVGIINQYDYKYNFETNVWEKTSDVVLEKEAYNLRTRLPVPVSDVPGFDKLKNIVSNIWDFLKEIFGF